jgi:hypothetical protein
LAKRVGQDVLLWGVGWPVGNVIVKHHDFVTRDDAIEGLELAVVLIPLSLLVNFVAARRRERKASQSDGA